MFGFCFVIVHENKSQTRSNPVKEVGGHIRYFVTASDARKAVADNDDAEAFGYEIHFCGSGEL